MESSKATIEKGIQSVVLNKLISLYLRVRFGNIDSSIKYFYRDTYRSRFRQWRYHFQDFVKRSPYKVISFSGEFAPELQFVLPHAYWHHKNGTLLKTQSSLYTRELYFFSPQHEESFETRTNEGNYTLDATRILYSHDYEMSKWLPVPLKQEYCNHILVFDKPILVIANRYNMEWGGPPVSFFTKEMIGFLVETLSPYYTVIYNRPGAARITNDNSDIYDLNELEWLKQTYPQVINMDDLYIKHKDSCNNFNHFQLMVYANTDRFVSIHGGTATLASYFGGVNLIYSVKGPEHHFKCYEKLYPQLSGARIFHAKAEEEVKQLIQQHFIPQPA